MIIKFYRKQVYGKQLRYIVDEIMAKLYENLTGEKTLTDSKEVIIKMMFGVEFEEVLPPTENK